MVFLTSSSKHRSCRRGQQREWIGERDQADIVMATGGVCLGVGTQFYCACLHGRVGLCWWYTLLVGWMQPSILACQVGCMIYWPFLEMNRDPWRFRRRVTFALKSQISERPMQCSPLTVLFLLMNRF